MLIDPPARAVPDEIAVKRSDPIYNAHAYLTKIPVAAIVPFIEAYTERGDLVCDMYAGSGMTGIAAAICGRRAALSDISVLGRHIGRGYVTVVDADGLRATADEFVARAQARVGHPYDTRCAGCQRSAVLSRTTWTLVYECTACQAPINDYRALEAADWRKTAMRCECCLAPVATRSARRLAEEPVVDTIACSCERKLIDQPPAPAVFSPPSDLRAPSAHIAADRQMFQASALGKHGLHSTADFYSERNLFSLAALHEAINSFGDRPMREQLLFAFTATLTRASKRYQWSKKRPLNASNANYYIAPVFYEWNVFDLFDRKIEAVLRSDDYLRCERRRRGVTGPIDVDYRIASADRLDLVDASVDYVFCDPPFGSNLFYSDMSLFQEAWLGQLTEHDREAVVDRTRGVKRRTTARYEELLTNSLREAYRVLKPDGRVSMNFSNSSGALWALVQRAIGNAGCVLEPGAISVLDKGQRSVKGLASGFENVVTADLVLTMRKQADSEAADPIQTPPEALRDAVAEALPRCARALTPTRVYLEVVRAYLRHRWDLSNLDISAIGSLLVERGLDVDPASGRLVTRDECVAAA